MKNFFYFLPHTLRMDVIFCLLFFLFSLFGMRAEGQNASRQRQINEAVASLERARRAILETPNLRTENEDLIHYFRKILNPAKPQISTDTQKRWIELLAKAVTETASYREVPPLATRTVENRRVWSQAANALKKFPVSVQALAQVSFSTNSPKEKTNPKAKAQAYVHMILILVEARDALRNARP